MSPDCRLDTLTLQADARGASSPRSRVIPVTPTTPKSRLVRCEKCLKLNPPDWIKETKKGDLVCTKCHVILQKKAKPKDPKPEPKWYVIACETGTENRVRREITTLSKIERLDDKILKVMVPKHKDRVQKDDGRLVPIRRKAFSGYVLVYMVYDPTTHHLCDKARSKGAFGLLPLKPGFTRKDPKSGRGVSRAPTEKELEDRAAWRPHAVETEEMAMVLLQDQKSRETEEVDVKFTVNDQVQVTGGIWRGQTGKVLSVSGEGDEVQLTIEVKVFGNPVVVPNVKHWEVEKA